MNLSQHFTLAELCHTGTGLPNDPPREVVSGLTLLCAAVLEPIRAHYGRPVKINSGYRGPAVNKAVGSKSTSQHTMGQAADLEIPGVSNLDLARWIKVNLPFDQLILEAHRVGDPSSGWVHVSFRQGSLRHQALTATMGSHGMVYSAGLPS